MISSMMTIFHKEMMDGLRDRRSLLGAAAFAVFMPLLLAMVFTGLASQEDDDSLPTVHVENPTAAPDLLDMLQAQGYAWQAANGDLARGVSEGEVVLGLRIHPEFGERFEAGRPARVEILVDESSNRRQSRDLGRAIQSWSGEVAQLRLQLRGVSGELIRPVNLQYRDHSTPAQRSAQLLGSLVIFLLIVPFVAGMSVAIDSLAGERERRSLEKLMVQPVTGWQIVFGKGLATMVFGLGGLALMLLASGLVLPRVDLTSLGMSLYLPVETLLVAFVVVAPIAMLAAGLQSLVSLLTRSFKEAQLYMSALMFVPMMVVFGLEFLDVPEGRWQAVTPIVSQFELLGNLLRQELPAVSAMLLATVTTLLAGAMVFWLASSLVDRERVVLS